MGIVETEAGLWHLKTGCKEPGGAGGPTLGLGRGRNSRQNSLLLGLTEEEETGFPAA